MTEKTTRKMYSPIENIHEKRYTTLPIELSSSGTKYTFAKTKTKQKRQTKKRRTKKQKRQTMNRKGRSITDSLEKERNEYVWFKSHH